MLPPPDDSTTAPIKKKTSFVSRLKAKASGIKKPVGFMRRKIMGGAGKGGDKAKQSINTARTGLSTAVGQYKTNRGEGKGFIPSVRAGVKSGVATTRRNNNNGTIKPKSAKDDRKFPKRVTDASLATSRSLGEKTKRTGSMGKAIIKGAVVGAATGGLKSGITGGPGAALFGATVGAVVEGSKAAVQQKLKQKKAKKENKRNVAALSAPQRPTPMNIAMGQDDDTGMRAAPIQRNPFGVLGDGWERPVRETNEKFTTSTSDSSARVYSDTTMYGSPKPINSKYALYPGHHYKDIPNYDTVGQPYEDYDDDLDSMDSSLGDPMMMSDSSMYGDGLGQGMGGMGGMGDMGGAEGGSDDMGGSDSGGAGGDDQGQQEKGRSARSRFGSVMKGARRRINDRKQKIRDSREESRQAKEDERASIARGDEQGQKSARTRRERSKAATKELKKDQKQDRSIEQQAKRSRKDVSTPEQNQKDKAKRQQRKQKRTPEQLKAQNDKSKERYNKRAEKIKTRSGEKKALKEDLAKTKGQKSEARTAQKARLARLRKQQKRSKKKQRKSKKRRRRRRKKAIRRSNRNRRRRSSSRSRSRSRR